MVIHRTFLEWRAGVIRRPADCAMYLEHRSARLQSGFEIKFKFM